VEKTSSSHELGEIAVPVDSHIGITLSGGIALSPTGLVEALTASHWVNIGGGILICLPHSGSSQV